jgi:hypothetical protein
MDSATVCKAIPIPPPCRRAHNAHRHPVPPNSAQVNQRHRRILCGRTAF